MEIKQQRRQRHQWQEFQCHSQASRLKAARERIVGQVIRKEITVDEGEQRLFQIEHQKEDA